MLHRVTVKLRNAWPPKSQSPTAKRICRQWNRHTHTPRMDPNGHDQGLHFCRLLLFKLQEKSRIVVQFNGLVPRYRRASSDDADRTTQVVQWRVIDGFQSQYNRTTQFLFLYSGILYQFFFFFLRWLESDNSSGPVDNGGRNWPIFIHFEFDCAALHRHITHSFNPKHIKRVRLFLASFVTSRK